MSIKDPNDANALGIGMVHQHFMLIQPFTVTENIILGMEPTKGLSVDKAIARKKVLELSERYGMKVDPDAKIEDISVGMQQRVEILKVLYRGAETLILDEPTAFLDFPSKVEIMQLLHHLSRSTNKTIFLSTHDLELALQIADKIWLMDKANGVTIGTPEDLSIDGCLSNFFSRKGIVFDMETGLFRIDNEFEKEVRLVGHGNKYAMVRKALQRNGILASRRVESDFYIETGDMTTSGYIIHPVAGRTIKVDTIEELLEQVTAILASV